MCAIAGMAVPAIVYLSVAGAGPAASGWAIPTATDVALAVGLLALVAPGIPSGARAFLLTLAVADDLGGVLVICLWYSQDAEVLPVLGALAIAVAMALLVASGRIRLSHGMLLILPAWYLMSAGRIEPATIGAIFGLLVPIRCNRRGRNVADETRLLLHRLEPLVMYGVLPLFAVVSASIVIGVEALQPGVIAGAALGLALGKPIGIIGAAWLLVRSGIGRRPEGRARRISSASAYWPVSASPSPCTSRT